MKLWLNSKGNVAMLINQINHVKIHIWVHSVTVIKTNEPLEQMLPYTVEIMLWSFDLYIGRLGGPSVSFQ